MQNREGKTVSSQNYDSIVEIESDKPGVGAWLCQLIDLFFGKDIKAL